MKYLLDTDICIFFLQGKHRIKDKINEVGIENCFLSEITIAELKYGAEKSNDYEKHSKEVDKMEELFTVIPIYEILDIYAKERVRLQREGNLIPDFDLLIGASSIGHKMIMVTNNEKHLERLNKVKIENWKNPAFNKFL
ncbi:MAG TPA: type II toxin-antitoxin system VapC family toxin [Bacteroidetes bacterium]|nr:type II toxin-antitoxin system VapC family toxin [Bacteroidota bacterium]